MVGAELALNVEKETFGQQPTRNACPANMKLPTAHQAIAATRTRISSALLHLPSMQASSDASVIRETTSRCMTNVTVVDKKMYTLSFKMTSQSPVRNARIGAQLDVKSMIVELGSI
jgi:hypothetical protein